VSLRLKDEVDRIIYEATVARDALADRIVFFKHVGAGWGASLHLVLTSVFMRCCGRVAAAQPRARRKHNAKFAIAEKTKQRERPKPALFVCAFCQGVRLAVKVAPKLAWMQIFARDSEAKKTTHGQIRLLRLTQLL